MRPSSSSPEETQLAPVAAPERRDPFRRIQKRDGAIVDFDPAKITHAVSRAAASVGEVDRLDSLEITDRVILLLARRYHDRHLLNIEEVQDAVEQVLGETSHYLTVQAYIRYRDERTRRRNLRLGRLPEASFQQLPADSQVEVATSGDAFVRWDREAIARALIRETGLSHDDARMISLAVEHEITHSKQTHLTAALIRELTNAKLTQLGLHRERRLHSRLGLPLYDVEQALHGRCASEQRLQSVEHFLAGQVLHQYALEQVFPASCVEAHLHGEIHLHDLDQPHLLDALLISPEAVLTTGVVSDWVGAAPLAAPPADLADAVTQVALQGAILSRCVSRQVLWDAPNWHLAPAALAEACPPEYLAQRLLREWSLQHQACHVPVGTQWHLCWQLPPQLVGRRPLALTGHSAAEGFPACADYARRLLLAILETVSTDNRPGMPRCVVHLPADCADAGPVFDLLASSGGVLGQAALAFDRWDQLRYGSIGPWAGSAGDASASRLLRGVLGRVSLNICRCALESRGDRQRLHELLTDRFNQAVAALRARRQFLRNLNHPEGQGHLGALLHHWRGVSLEQACIGRGCIGLVGLPEAAEIMTGAAPGLDDDSLRCALEIVSALHLLAHQHNRGDDLEILLDGRSAGTAAGRLFDCDRNHWQQQTAVLQAHVSGRYASGIPVPIHPDLPLAEALQRTGRFHDVLEAGAPAIIRIDAPSIDSSGLAEIFRYTASQTRCAELHPLTALTACRVCATVEGGCQCQCRQCGSSLVHHIIRGGDSPDCSA